MFLPDEVIALLELSNFSPTSIRTFDYSVKRLFSMMYGPLQKFNINKILKDYLTVINTIENSDAPLNSKKMLFHSISNVIKVSGIDTYPAMKILDARDKFSSYVDEMRAFQKKESVIPLDNIYPLIKSTFDDLELSLTDEYDPSKDVPYIILGFFIYLPPLRSQDYVNTRITSKGLKNNDDKINHINLEKSEMIINEYKTGKKYGQRKIHLPAPLVHILKEYKTKSKNKWLVPKLYGDGSEPMTNSAFTHFLNRVLGEKISTAELRRAYISQEVINKDMKGKERKNVAKIMAHSTRTQGEIYSKYSKLAD